MDSMIRAAELCEEEGRWSKAFAYWKELIAKYSHLVSSSQVEYWKMKMEYARKMK